MKFVKVTLDATDSAKALSTLVTALAGKRAVRIVIYAESTNHATASRWGGSDVHRTNKIGFPIAASAKEADLFDAALSVYLFDDIYVTGQTGDIFQVGYASL